jgi:hypothetical protein
MSTNTTNTILYAADELRADQSATLSPCEESHLGSTPSLDGGQRQVMITDFRAERSESVLASFSVTLLGLGMTISGCLLRQAAGQYWISLPASLRIEHGALKRDRRGRVAYRSLIRFRDKNAFRLFQAPILEELVRLGLIDGLRNNDSLGGPFMPRARATNEFGAHSITEVEAGRFHESDKPNRIRFEKEML